MGIPGVLQCTAVCTYIEEHSKITLMSEPGHDNAVYDTLRGIVYAPAPFTQILK